MTDTSADTLLLTILGPTASGKTRLAVKLAGRLNGEILSADSRQIYRGMDIGTGKDLKDYVYEGTPVPYHLIDIVEAGYKYNVYEYQRDFLKAWQGICERGKQPVLCGGTGLYLEAILKGYRLEPVPANPELRATLEQKSLGELTRILSGYKQLHNTTDVDTVKRAVRAIEIENWYRSHPETPKAFPAIPSLVFGVTLDRESRRSRITERLKSRLQEGMIEEVQHLMSDVSAEDLIYYGLEYKYVSLYLTGKLSYQEMVSQLEIAIHQFAKRQMTWFRGMEKRGLQIHWLNALDDPEENVNKIISAI
ncbi:MAG: tRNA (adenosine(37)-N6)-dimethylallyltransferase MiaA [Bacteroidota bacterium]|nr:tRNA (adenosine(37)-N6)-dimethylallyltransferase MiaA [Bacteroidota bacterium]